MKAPVVEVLEKATKPIFVYQSAKEGIDQFMQKNDKDLEHIFVGEYNGVFWIFNVSQTIPILLLFFQGHNCWLY